MKNKLIYLFPVITLLLSISYFACSGAPEDETVVLRDTLEIKVDTVIKQKKNPERVNLLLAVQLAAFNNENRAKDFVTSVKDKTGIAVDIKRSGSLYLVTAGSFTSVDKAEDYCNYFKNKGYDKAFVKNLNSK